MNKLKDACLVCGSALQYFETGREMECYFCHKTFINNVSCKEGHYVCDECHSKKAVDGILNICRNTSSKNPVEIAIEMMHYPYVYMHGPENHILVGAALLTAYKNCGGKLDFEAALGEMVGRGRQVPGGACGFWGCCGAAVSAGMFVSIATGATPLSKESSGLSNLMTAAALGSIGKIGGPRCCKRNAFLAIKDALLFSEKHLGVPLLMPEKVVCTFYQNNNECIGKLCPFHPATIGINALSKVVAEIPKK